MYAEPPTPPNLIIDAAFVLGVAVGRSLARLLAVARVITGR